MSTSSLHQKPISVALVEDDPGLRAQLSEWVTRQGTLQLLSSYGNAEDALAAKSTCKPDVWLVDINLPKLSGIAFVARLNQAATSPAKVLMLTAYEDGERIFEALKAGAIGYLLKRHAARQLLDAIHQLHDGGAPMSPEIARKVVTHFHQSGRQQTELHTLTPRERDILDQLSKGCPYKEIAANSGLSIDTVRTHLRSIYDKLHVHSRTEAVVKYLGG
jgi:DNA-binding NarL/FixJ family response regulator